MPATPVRELDDSTAGGARVAPVNMHGRVSIDADPLTALGAVGVFTSGLLGGWILPVAVVAAVAVAGVTAALFVQTLKGVPRQRMVTMTMVAGCVSLSGQLAIAVRLAVLEARSRAREQAGQLASPRALDRALAPVRPLLAMASSVHFWTVLVMIIATAWVVGLRPRAVAWANRGYGLIRSRFGTRLAHADHAEQVQRAMDAWDPERRVMFDAEAPARDPRSKIDALTSFGRENMATVLFPASRGDDEVRRVRAGVRLMHYSCDPRTRTRKWIWRAELGEQIRPFEEEVSSYLSVPVDWVEVGMPRASGNAGMILITVQEPPLAGALPLFELPPVGTVKNGLCFGKTMIPGVALRLRFLFVNTLVGGTTQSGKTVFGQMLIGTLARCRDVWIPFAFDLSVKQGASFDGFMSRGKVIDLLTTKQRVRDGIAWLDAEARRRADAGLADNFAPSESWPLIVVPIDELPLVFDDPDLSRLVENAAATWLGVGISLVGFTQRGTKDMISRRARAMFAQQVCFATASEAEAQYLHDDLKARLPNASFPVPGEGWCTVRSAESRGDIVIARVADSPKGHVLEVLRAAGLATEPARRSVSDDRSSPASPAPVSSPAPGPLPAPSPLASPDDDVDDYDEFAPIGDDQPEMSLPEMILAAISSNGGAIRRLSALTNSVNTLFGVAKHESTVSRTAKKMAARGQLAVSTENDPAIGQDVQVYRKAGC